LKYWDSSALVALVIDEARSPEVRGLYSSDPRVTSWTLSEVEVHSAIERVAREGKLTASRVPGILASFDTFWPGVDSLMSIDAVKIRAKRLLRFHALRAADALQLAAALTAVYDQPAGRDFVSLDDRLRDAAAREGFRVLP